MRIVFVLALLAQTTAPAMLAPAAKKPDACALLSDADVRAVLGVAVKGRQPASHEARGLLLSQCYLGTGTSRSVSIAVAGNTRIGSTTVTPRAFWREQFHRVDEHERREMRERDETREPERESEARPIRGIGDEAYWSGTRLAGALYVLRGNTFIRVSVGGIQSEQERIDKSRQLAASALSRLP
jgi:hypothetical protein